MHAQFLSGYSRCLPSLFCAARDASFPLRAAVRKCFGDAPRFNGPLVGRPGGMEDGSVRGCVVCMHVCVYACVRECVCVCERENTNIY